MQSFGEVLMLLVKKSLEKKDNRWETLLILLKTEGFDCSSTEMSF